MGRMSRMSTRAKESRCRHIAWAKEYRGGRSTRNIAFRHGVTHQAVSLALRNMGQPRRPCSVSKISPDVLRREAARCSTLVDLAKAVGMSVWKSDHSTGRLCRREHILRLLRRYKISFSSATSQKNRINCELASLAIPHFTAWSGAKELRITRGRFYQITVAQRIKPIGRVSFAGTSTKVFHRSVVKRLQRRSSSAGRPRR